MFGIDLVNIIREEKPEWFGPEYEQLVNKLCLAAYEAEEEIIDWMYEGGDLDFLPKQVVKEFVKLRMNNSLKATGLKPLLDVDAKLVGQTDWFDNEVIATKHVDFFQKRSINYNKRSACVTSSDLF